MLNNTKEKQLNSYDLFNRCALLNYGSVPYIMFIVIDFRVPEFQSLSRELRQGLSRELCFEFEELQLYQTRR